MFWDDLCANNERRKGNESERAILEFRFCQLHSLCNGRLR
jgi:hypothetical protein